MLQMKQLSKILVGIETDINLVPLKSVAAKIIYKLFISGKFESSTPTKFLNMFVFVDSVIFRLFSEFIMSLIVMFFGAVSPTSIVPYRSATKVNQSETTLKCFYPLRTHKYHTHTHTPFLMMGEVSLEKSPKNVTIQDMINSENSTYKVIF